MATASSTIVDFLRQPASYPDEAGAVEVVETHISWVFLTAGHAYKLKKPVQFEFLDFSTPQLREHACHEELRLNRRLAPDVYLAVVPVVQAADGRLRLGGEDGQPIDWLVKMRRLPAEQALDAVLRDDRLTNDQARAIADYLASFYARQPPVRMEAGAYCRALERHVRANGEALLAAPRDEQSAIARLQSAQLRYLAVAADSVGCRAVEGRLIDGHGDLRPEHVYVDNPPVVIDCLEFSAELRTVDIADELSFLAMECERLGHGTLGELVLATYQETCADRPSRSLLAFYRSYRACVRAKIVLLRQQQKNGTRVAVSSDFNQYLRLAERYAQQLGPPCLVVLGGLMGSGKSTLAAALAHTLGADVLSTDRTRRALVGESTSAAGYGEGLYRLEMREQVYEALFAQGGELLREGRSVILDGAFLGRRLRERAFRLAEEGGAVPMFVLCTCPRETAQERIDARARAGGSESEARRDLYDRQARDFEPPLAHEPVVLVDTTDAQQRQLEHVCDELRRRILP